MPVRFNSPPPAWMMPEWTDEAATIASCSLYVLGNVVFIVGSVCFFPRVIEAGGIAIEMLAVILFILGSALFTTGAIVDLIVIARGPRLVKAAAAPQLRGLSLGRWPTRPSPATPRGAFARAASKQGGGAQPPARRYHVMQESLPDIDGLPSPTSSGRDEIVIAPAEGAAAACNGAVCEMEMMSTAPRVGAGGADAARHADGDAANADDGGAEAVNGVAPPASPLPAAPQPEPGAEPEAHEPSELQ